MKRFINFIKLVFVAPTMFFTRLHSNKLDFEGKFHLTRIWANFILRGLSVRIQVKNANLIPLEDGYTFISNHDNNYDGLLMISANPLDFSFFSREKSRLPYMTAFLKLIDTIFYSPTTVADDLIDMSQKLTQKHNFHMFISDPKEGSITSDLLNAAYLSKTAIIPVAIRNARSIMKFGRHTVTVSFCTPLHFEEYGPLDPAETLAEITKRIESELKEG